MKKKLILLVSATIIGLTLNLSFRANSVDAATTTKETLKVRNNSISTRTLLSEKIYGPIPLNGWGKGPGYTWYQNVPENPYKAAYWRGKRY